MFVFQLLLANREKKSLLSNEYLVYSFDKVFLELNVGVKRRRKVKKSHQESKMTIRSIQPPKI